MVETIKRSFREGMVRTVRERVRTSTGLKFMLAVTGVIALLMVLGTTFVTKMMVDYQYKALEARGREIGMVLGKSAVDDLITNNFAQLNLVVADLVRADDIVALVVETADGTPVTTARTSFNRESPGVDAVLNAEKPRT